MPRLCPAALTCLVTILMASGASSAEPTVVLLEENAAELLKELTNPTGDPGQGHVEKTETFSGKSAVKIIPMQRFHPGIPGWKYRITAKPKPGEYRYLRLAWKADGCAGIMIQFHDATNWNLRYTAGIDQQNWGSKFVADQPPTQWTVVTCDLHKDFGDRTLQGIALTAFGGQAAYFDHIYLGRTIEDLDRIDATDYGNRELPDLNEESLTRLWDELGSDDAKKAYHAHWRLVAAPKQAVKFLRKELTVRSSGPDGKVIAGWIKELDDPRFDVRQSAHQKLLANLKDAAPALESSARTTMSPEVKLRIRRLLSKLGGVSVNHRLELAVQVLEYIGTSEASDCLKHLSELSPPGSASEFAKLSLQRVAKRAASKPAE